MIYHNIDDYLKALSNFNNTSGKIINGVGYYEVNGELIPDEIFFQHNSKPTYEVAAKINPDGTCLCAGIIPKKSRR